MNVTDIFGVTVIEPCLNTANSNITYDVEFKKENGSGFHCGSIWISRVDL